MGIVLSIEQDREIRQYAKRMHSELGEDAYHMVISDVLRQGKEESIRDIVGYIRHAMKYALYKIFRHERAERQNIQAFVNNDPIPMLKGFVPGDVPHRTCRKGHVWSEHTTVYIGKQRTCGICRKKYSEEYYKKHHRR